MAEIGTLLFDLDDTLLVEADYLRAVVVEFIDRCGMRSDWIKDVLSDIPRIRRDRVDVLGAILADLGLMNQANHDLLFEIYCTLNTNLEPIDGAQQLFDTAATRNWNIVVLTNGVPDAQIAKWSSLRLDGADRAVFMPARLVGGDKPKAEVFEAALDAVGGDWSTVLAVGDKFEIDLAFPRSKGARTFHVNCESRIANSETTGAGALAQLVAIIKKGFGQ